jgi:RNA polymerase sigma factor (sigma-70 family)
MTPRTPGDAARLSQMGTDDLLQDVRDGRAALFELVTRFADDLRQANAAGPPGPNRPSDAAQEWLTAFQERFVRLLPSFESEAAFRGYLRECVRNQLRSDAGRNGKRPAVPLDDAPEPVDAETASEVARANEEDALLTRAVAALGEADRLIYRLCYQRNWSHRDLAELLFGGRDESHRQKVIRRLRDIERQLERLIWGQDGTPEGSGHEQRGEP